MQSALAQVASSKAPEANFVVRVSKSPQGSTAHSERAQEAHVRLSGHACTFIREITRGESVRPVLAASSEFLGGGPTHNYAQRPMKRAGVTAMVGIPAL